MKLTIEDWRQRYLHTWIVYNGLLHYVDGIYLDERRPGAIRGEQESVFFLLRTPQQRSPQTVPYDPHKMFLELPPAGLYNSNDGTVIQLYRLLGRQYKRTLCESNSTAVNLTTQRALSHTHLAESLNNEMIQEPNVALRMVMDGEVFGKVLSRRHAVFASKRCKGIINTSRVFIGTIDGNTIKPTHELLKQELIDVVSRHRLSLELV